MSVGIRPCMIRTQETINAVNRLETHWDCSQTRGWRLAAATVEKFRQMRRVPHLGFPWLLPSGKLLHNCGKSPFLMGKLTISMAIFNSHVSHYQRVLSSLPIIKSHQVFPKAKTTWLQLPRNQTENVVVARDAQIISSIPGHGDGRGEYVCGCMDG